MTIHLRLWLILLLLITLNMTASAQSDEDDWIAFAAERTCASGGLCARDIKIINLNDETFIYLPTQQSIYPEEVRFSPDGLTVSYIASRGVFHLVDVETQEQIFQLEINELGFRSYRWAPDGTMIAIVEGESRTVPGHVYLLNLQTFEYEQLQLAPDLDVNEVSWSPDSTQLLFSANFKTNFAFSSSDIYVFDLETAELTNLTNNPGINFAPVWSSDGSRFAYVSGDKRPQRLIVQQGLDVLQEIEIDVEFFGSPTWALNDQSIVFFVQDRNSLLAIVDLETEEWRLLNGHVPITGFDLSADGEQIVYLTTAPTSDLCVHDLPTHNIECRHDEPTFFFARPVWRFS